jgi:hypothetical protein
MHEEQRKKDDGDATQQFLTEQKKGRKKNKGKRSTYQREKGTMKKRLSWKRRN